MAKAKWEGSKADEKIDKVAQAMLDKASKKGGAKKKATKKSKTY
jgi:hypothetical protein